MTRAPRVAIIAAVLSIIGVVAVVDEPVGALTLFPPTTQPPPPEPPPPPPPPPTLRRGDQNTDVQSVQQRLKNLAYDPGAINGSFGEETEFAVVAFQTVQGLAPSGQVTPDVRAALEKPVLPRVLAGRLGTNRVEVDIGQQLMTIYRNGVPALISHVSTGNNQRYCNKGKCAYAVTPRGTFAVGRKVKGWETSPLGRLYNSVYFYKGFALHGSSSVPLQPASHGCVRVPMHTAAWFQQLVPKGMPVYVGG